MLPLGRLSELICTCLLAFFPFVTKDVIYRYKMKVNLFNKNYFLSVSDIIVYLIEESYFQ